MHSTVQGGGTNVPRCPVVGCPWSAFIFDEGPTINQKCRRLMENIAEGCDNGVQLWPSLTPGPLAIGEFLAQLCHLSKRRGPVVRSLVFPIECLINLVLISGIVGVLVLGPP